jgi:hypothetical protein
MKDYGVKPVKVVNGREVAWGPDDWRSFNDGWSFSALGYPQRTDQDPKLFNLGAIEQKAQNHMNKPEEAR